MISCLSCSNEHSRTPASSFTRQHQHQHTRQHQHPLPLGSSICGDMRCCHRRATNGTARAASASATVPSGRASARAQSPATLSGRGEQALDAATQAEKVSIAISDDTVYGVGMDQRIYKQKLNTMTADSAWTTASKGKVTAIAIRGDTIYGVGVNNRIYMQKLSSMTPDSAWTQTNKGSITAIAISEDPTLSSR